MKIFARFDSPLYHIVSFEKVIEDWESQLLQYPENNMAKELIRKTEQIPELRNGFRDLSIIDNNRALIDDLLSCIFPKLLTNTNISAASFPWSNQFFNATQRFEDLIEESGRDFCINDDEFDEDSFYIAQCSIILSRHYDIPISSYFPLYFNFRDRDGINKHYRIVYNADFLEITPTEKAIELSKKDIDYLLDNPNDIALWKEKFPSQSWLIKGFGIMSMFETTVETAFSNLKQRLSTNTLIQENHEESENEILKSIFNIKSIQVGISNYNFEKQIFITDFYNLVTDSLILSNQHYKQNGFKIENSILVKHIENNKPLIVSNLANFLERYPDDKIIAHLFHSGFNSCALIPLKKEDKFLGIAELASEIPSAFNSLTSYRINMIYNFLVDRLERGISEFSNLKSSIIQKEYTTLHSSVAWKFDREVQNYLRSQKQDYNFKEIVFKDVIALFGDVDIKNSSKTQNKSIKADIKNQVDALIQVLDYLFEKTQIELIEQKKFELIEKYKVINKGFKANSEVEIQQYIANEINPILINPDIYQGEEGIVADYLKTLDPINGRYYHKRKMFDDSINMINQRLVAIIDHRQKEVQQIYPHYFERFKTDGVDHTIYIGSSISPKKKYNKIYLQNLRLWQLQVTCEMLREHNEIYKDLPIPLDMTSLILVFNQEISIRFRMDEKRFDVDGSYNAQYEVLKKRIDKSHIKGTNERVTQEGKIVVVYSNPQEENEYLDYIRFLQNKGRLNDDIEFLEIESLQGVIGLKALRVGVKFETEVSNIEHPAYFSFDELLKDMN